MTTLPATVNKVAVRKYNELYNRLYCDDGVAQELKEFFTFKVPNYQYHILFKKRLWNGDITLFHIRNRLLYAGLLPYVEKFCKERNYACLIGDGLNVTDEFSIQEAMDFIASLKMPSAYDMRPYQIKSFVYCVRHRRALFVSPTASGKSLIIYWLTRFYKLKTLIIVDSINLLNQMFSDFDKYGFEVEKNVHLICSGAAKNSTKPIIITTWQSAATQPKEWFEQFGVVIGDEAHRYKAMSLKGIMESLPDCKYRFGFTGSLDGSESNQMVLEGLFGPYKRIVTTKRLIDEGHLSDVTIKAILLKYDEATRKQYSNTDYESEILFIYANEKRNRFIENLALSLKGNTILLFQRVEKHGVHLHASLIQKAKCPVYYVSGDVEGKDREAIRKIVNLHDNSITVASVGTFSIGVDIPRLNNIIIASPTKSTVRILQTIGRGLRKTDDKTHCTVFDIADNLQWKRHANHTLRHFGDRMKVYIKEEFKYKLYHVELR